MGKREPANKGIGERSKFPIIQGASFCILITVNAQLIHISSLKLIEQIIGKRETANKGIGEGSKFPIIQGTSLILISVNEIIFFDNIIINCPLLNQLYRP